MTVPGGRGSGWPVQFQGWRKVGNPHSGGGWGGVNRGGVWMMAQFLTGFALS